MDHQFRKIREGLVQLEPAKHRGSREEWQVYVDEFAFEAILKYVPSTYLTELQGWARSVYSKDQHLDALLAYGNVKIPEPTDVSWNQTKQSVMRMFKRFDKIRTTSYKDFDSVRWISASSAGYGYIGTKGDNDNYKRARKTAVTIAEKLDHDRSYAPAALAESTPDIAFTRTQLSQIKVKTKVRNVWGEAFHYVLLEGLFADPLIEFFKGAGSFYFIGQDPLLSVPALIEEIVKDYDYIYMLDWSAFDASVQEWEIRFAFDCLGAILMFPSNIEAQIWRFVIELFIYRKVSAPDDMVYLKTLGIPSGSCFTNMIGSIVNFVRIQYIFIRLSGSFVTAYTHGDDSLIGVSTTQFVPLARFSEVCVPLGWNININKSEVSRQGSGVTFLSRSVRESSNYRDEMVCLRMLTYPEYPVLSGDISALRAKSIYQDAGLFSRFLFNIFLYLKEKHGLAQSLPYNLRVWDLLEYETRKSSYSELM